MKLEFNSFSEMVDFINEMGFKIERKEFASDEEIKRLNEELEKLKNMPARKLNDTPWWNPFEPHFPSYPYSPITLSNEQLKEKRNPPTIQCSGDVK